MSLNNRTFFSFGRSAWLFVLTSLAMSPANALETLFDGTFETGTFQGWTAGSDGGGVAFTAGKGTCFSNDDTTGIQLAGNYAALLRSGREGRKDSFGTLTSLPFESGDGIAFGALSETRDGKTIRAPINFFVRILNADNGNTLSEHQFNTAVVRLSQGCPSKPRTAGFSAHFVDTRRYRGTSIQVQFRQSTNVGGEGFFTLVDNVTRFGPGELPIFTSKPIAKAGTSFTERGTLRLDGSLSFDPNGQALEYNWFINDESTPRTGEVECIGDLEAGDFTVTLYVNDGYAASADTMLLAIPNESGRSGDETTTGDDSGDNNDDTNDDANDDQNNNDNGDDNNTNNANSGDPGCEGDGRNEQDSDEDNDDDNGTDNGDDNGTDGDDDGTDDGDGNGTDNGGMDNGTGGGDNNTGITLDLDGSSNGTGFQNTFTIGGAAVPVADTDTTITVPDNGMIDSARIRIDSPQNGDNVTPSGTLPTGISFAQESQSVLNLTGEASATNYATALSQIVFNSSSPTPPAGTRTIQITVTSASATSTAASATITVQQ